MPASIFAVFFLLYFSPGFLLSFIIGNIHICIQTTDGHTYICTNIYLYLYDCRLGICILYLCGSNGKYVCLSVSVLPVLVAFFKNC